MLLFLRPPSDSTTTVPGSFTVDAIIIATETDTVTVDAVILRTQEGSFTADAVMLRTQTTSSTPVTVVGGGLTVVEDDVSPATASSIPSHSVGDRLVVLFVCNGDFGSPPDAFSTPSGWTEIGSQVVQSERRLAAYTKIATSTNDAFSISVSPSSLTREKHIHYWALTPGEVVAASHNADSTSDTTWNVDGLTGSAVGGIVFHGAVVGGNRGLDAPSGEVSFLLRGQTGSANDLNTRSGYLSFTGSNPAATSGTITNGSTVSEGWRVLVGPPLLGLTANAVLAKTVDGSFTTDAITFKTQADAFTTDAILFRSTSATISLDALLFATVASSYTLDAVLFATTSGSFTLDATSTSSILLNYTLDAVIQATTSAAATLDAVIQATTSAEYELDATLAATQTSTWTFDAIVLGTSETTFTFDAVIFRTTESGYLFDAILLGATSGAFTLDAELASSAGTGSFALDAIIFATSSASLLLDAEIAGVSTNNGSFSIDAVVMARLFQDTFTRTVSPGLGGPWSWGQFDSSVSKSGDSPIEVGGSFVQLRVDNGGYDSWAGFQYADVGDGWFDFYVPPTIPNNGRPTYALNLDPFNYYGVVVEVYNDLRIHQFDYANITYITPTTSTWYRLHARWTTDRVMINVFPASSAEPSGWQYDETRVFSYHDDAYAPPFFDFYWNPTTGGVGVPMVDNVEIWSMASTWIGFGGFQLDAYFVRTLFTLDAEIEHRKFQFDAYIRGTVVRSGVPATEPLFVGASGASNSSAVSSIVVSKPTGTVNGDLLIALVFTRDATTTSISSTGWVARRTATLANSRMTYLFARTAGGDPSTYTFSASTAVGFNVIIMAFRGVTQVNQHQYDLTTDSPYDAITTALIELSHPGMLIQGFQSASFSPGAMSTVSGMTEAIDQQDYFIQQAADYVPVLSVGGLVGGGSTTISNSDPGSPRLGWSILLGKSGNGVVLDAVIGYRTFTLSAVLAKTGISQSFSFDAWLGGFNRQQHNRGNVPHYNVDLDTIVVLASAVGADPTGTDLHTVLSHLEAHITALEGGYLYQAFRLNAVLLIPSFVLDATFIGSSVRAFYLDAIGLRPESATFDLDAALVFTISSAITMDAFVQPWFTLDAFIGGNTFDATAFEPSAFD